MDDTTAFTSDFEKHKTEIKTALEKGRDKHFVETLQRSLDEWKGINLNIGVTGRSGVGKSTLINTIRGLTGECPGAAETGATETTSEAKAYPHPVNEKMVLWDLPGLGTETFPRDTYFNDTRVQFDKYDMFLILSSQRFLEDDLILAEEAQKRNKLFIFIRTKVDIDVASERRSKPLKYKNENAEKELLGQIRNALIKGLKDNIMFTEKSLFLIDGQDMSWNKFDFEKLINRLIGGFAGLKREAFILTLNVLQANVLEQKVAVLKKRIWKVSLLSAVGAAIPVPVVSAAVDTVLIVEESFFYLKQLGISKADIENTCKMLSIDMDTLKRQVDLKSMVIYGTSKGITTCLSLIAISGVAENLSKFFIPIVGIAIASVASFSSTYAILIRILNMIETDSKRFLTYLQDRASST